MQFVPQEDSQLLDVLAKMTPSGSKTTLRSWIKEGRVTVDGQPVKQSNLLVCKGQKVAVEAKAKFLPKGIRVLYEDKHLVAIEKPEGLLSVATAFEKGETVHAILKSYYHPHPVHVVHRLDQDTSGVMLFTLSEEGYEGLKKLFQEHAIERSYCAIVEGRIAAPSGTWQSYLYEDSNYVVHSSGDPSRGSLAITHYRLLHHSKGYSRLELTLETGRKNQIRVQCSEHGHPIVGDKKYGASTNPIQRLCLHAHMIAFIHPVTGKPLKFISLIPQIFDRLVKNKS